MVLPMPSDKDTLLRLPRLRVLSPTRHPSHSTKINKRIKNKYRKWQTLCRNTKYVELDPADAQHYGEFGYMYCTSKRIDTLATAYGIGNGECTNCPHYRPFRTIAGCAF